MNTLIFLFFVAISTAVVVATWRNGLVPSIVYLLGLGIFYVAERIFGGAELQPMMVGLSLTLLILYVLFRLDELGKSTGHRAKAQRAALGWSLLGMGALVIYGFTTDSFNQRMGIDEDGAAYWYVIWTSLFPILLVVGTLPTLALDRVLARNPLALPAAAKPHAVEAGLVTALVIALLFPVNYLASSYSQEWNFSYFRTAEAGSSTLALASGLSEPVEVFLFYSPANDVKEQIVPYFGALESAAAGNLQVKVVDQPVEPQLSEELKIRDNGYVVFRQGEAIEKFKLSTELKRAKRDLKKLDETVQKHLLKLAKGKRTAYMLVGHGEASSRGTTENPLYKMSLFKKTMIAQNYTVKDFGIDDGSMDAVPDDAAVVIVAAPEKELLDEEIEVLNTYLDNGGGLLLMLDPERNQVGALLDKLGVNTTTGGLAHETEYFRLGRTIGNPSFLATNSFGTHAASSTLSKFSSQLMLLAPTALGLEETTGSEAEFSTVVRSKPNTFEDLNRNFKRDDDEPRGKVHTLVAAVEGAGDDGFRAVVIGDVSVFSDPMLQVSQGNDVLALDTLRWLVGDEEIAGEVNNEEDVKIQHTREQDQIWFYGLIVFPPTLVILLGALLIRTRRNRR